MDIFNHEPRINTTEKTLLEKIDSHLLLLKSCIITSYFELTISDCSVASIVYTLWSNLYGIWPSMKIPLFTLFPYQWWLLSWHFDKTVRINTHFIVFASPYQNNTKSQRTITHFISLPIFTTSTFIPPQLLFLQLMFPSKTERCSAK